MNGRTENRIKTEKMIYEKLDKLPGFMTEYYLMLSGSGIEPKTCNIYINRVVNFLNSIDEDINSIDISKITDTSVSKYMSGKIIKEANGEIKETSTSYRQGVHTALKNFFECMHKKGYVTKNPVDAVSRPRSKDDVKRIKLTQKDFNMILDAVEHGNGTPTSMRMRKKWKERDKLMLYLFMTTGMRRTALSEINISDINMESSELSVIDKRHKTHVYYLDDVAKKLIVDWMVKRDEFLKQKNSNTQALFVSSFGTRITSTTIENLVKRYSLEGLGYEISPHKLRSAFCTILYEETNDIEFVRQAVGHSSISTTQRYIVHDNSAKKKSTSIISSGLKI